MKINEIPIHAIGSGSQPEESDGAQLDYPSLPTEMSVYHVPSLPEADELDGLEAGIALMDRLQNAAASYSADTRPIRFDLSQLDARNLDFINQLLGDGDVSIRDERNGAAIQESVLTGVWRVREQQRDYVEIANLPTVVRNSAFADASAPIKIDPAQMRAGVVNAAPVLAEVMAKSVAYKSGATAHVINLTLLPLSPEDLFEIDRTLGRGPVTILSRGYGNCRITTTSVRNIWRVQYFNSGDALILDTLEVTDAPSAACAENDDIAQSAERLIELREMLGQ